MVKLPQWVKLVFASSIVATIAWAIQDRMTIGERLAANQEVMKSIDKRLERIEVTLDRIEIKNTLGK